MEAKHATQDHKIRVQVSPLQFMYNFTHKAKSNHLYILGNAKQIIAARARERQQRNIEREESKGKKEMNAGSLIKEDHRRQQYVPFLPATRHRISPYHLYFPAHRYYPKTSKKTDVEDLKSKTISEFLSLSSTFLTLEYLRNCRERVCL